MRYYNYKEEMRLQEKYGTRYLGSYEALKKVQGIRENFEKVMTLKDSDEYDELVNYEIYLMKIHANTIRALIRGE